MQNLKHIAKFLRLPYAPDILRYIHHLGNPMKEITESMGLIDKVKKYIIDYAVKDKKVLFIDFAAGSGTTSFIVHYRFKNTITLAIDKTKNTSFLKAGNLPGFYFLEKKIIPSNFQEILKKIEEIKREHNIKRVVTAGIHPCESLVLWIAELSSMIGDEVITAVMPCCVGEMDSVYTRIGKFFAGEDKYLLWSYYVARMMERFGFKIRKMLRDDAILSPLNVIIVGEKGI